MLYSFETTQILLLADLRDQAGRAASNVMVHVAFKQPIPENDLCVLYTWNKWCICGNLIDTLQPERDETEVFKVLHQAVYNEFLAKCWLWTLDDVVFTIDRTI